MITSVRIQDFKGHRDTTIPLGRFTALVGPNGSGKTSVLEALWLQSRLVERPSAAVLSGDWSPADLRRRGAQGPTVLASVGTRRGKNWNSRLEIALPGGEQETWSWKIGDKETKLNRSGLSLPIHVGEIAAAMGRASLYKLNVAKIAAAAYSDQPDAEVEYDGTNTAVALAALKLGYDEQFDRIEDELRRLVPNVERIRVRQATTQRPNPSRPSQMEKVVGHKVFFDFRGALGVPAHAASEGTLIVLSLLTVLHGTTRPHVLLLDDFDQSLHPQAQMELVRLIRRLLDELKNVQIVATTHSPYILDALAPADIHAFALREDGTVGVKRLSEHPQAEKMKGALSAGQLWSLDPERDWVLQEKAK